MYLVVCNDKLYEIYISIVCSKYRKGIPEYMWMCACGCVRVTHVLLLVSEGHKEIKICMCGV